ncbi:MAG TPA: hypothetical protein PKX84_09425, partial [Bacteroidia bacterium]|nr:hypothetical protein [Bacteroidia bacterium]
RSLRTYLYTINFTTTNTKEVKKSNTNHQTKQHELIFTLIYKITKVALTKRGKTLYQYTLTNKMSNS